MKRKVVIEASSNNIQLNTLKPDIVDLLIALGFQQVPTYAGLYVTLDSSGNEDIIFYEQDSNTFGRIVGGALDDNGQTFLSYVNARDGWEVFLEDFSECDVLYHADLEEVFQAEL